MNSITIQKGAIGEQVIVTCFDRTTVISLDDVSRYNKTNFLSDLIVWALNGYKGNPPTLNR